MNQEEYLELDFHNDDRNERVSFTRRQFLKTMGGGIFVFFTVGEAAALQQRRGQRRSRAPSDFNA